LSGKRLADRYQIFTDVFVLIGYALPVSRWRNLSLAGTRSCFCTNIMTINACVYYLHSITRSCTRLYLVVQPHGITSVRSKLWRPTYRLSKNYCTNFYIYIFYLIVILIFYYLYTVTSAYTYVLSMLFNFCILLFITGCTRLAIFYAIVHPLLGKNYYRHIDKNRYVLHYHGIIMVITTFRQRTKNSQVNPPCMA
jgi:hypothetical protein